MNVLSYGVDDIQLSCRMTAGCVRVKWRVIDIVYSTFKKK